MLCAVSAGFGAVVPGVNGVKIAFQTSDAANSRNLPYNAALAVAYGLDADAALRALTINAAVKPTTMNAASDLVASVTQKEITARVQFTF